MSLVKSDHVPIVRFRSQFWDELDALICCHTHIELPHFHLVCENLFSLALGRLKVDNAERRCPLPELFHPVRDRAFRRDNEEWTVLDPFRFPKVADHTYSHDGLSHAHVIRQKSVDVVFVERSEPLQEVKLVRL